MCKLLFLQTLFLTSAADPIDTGAAEKYFAEARALSERDDGALWGVRLYGPILFVDRESRFAVANQADQQGLLTSRGGVFVGTLPESLGLANTSTTWAGVEWTMVLWPLPEDPHERAALVLHECFHRVQDEIGIAGGDPINQHLSAEDGRVWMQLEWRALAEALTSEGKARKQAINDALLFRAIRHERYAEAAKTETTLELHEGLAEYTGLRLCGRGEASARTFAAGKLKEAERNKSFVRSFAYVTGPAYGLLLDALGGDWRSQAKKGRALGDLLGEAVGARAATNVSLGVARGAAYGGDALRAAERKRAAEHAQRIADYRERLIEGPVLRLPSRSPNITFDPRTPVVLEGVGTVYPGLELRDEWGMLRVTSGGALLMQDWSAVHVVAPNGEAGAEPSGDGWTLQLNEGWRLGPGKRAGDWSALRD